MALSRPVLSPLDAFAVLLRAQGRRKKPWKRVLRLTHSPFVRLYTHVPRPSVVRTCRGCQSGARPHVPRPSVAHMPRPSVAHVLRPSESRARAAAVRESRTCRGRFSRARAAVQSPASVAAVISRVSSRPSGQLQKSYERAELCYDVAHGLHKEEEARRAERGEALRGARLSSPRPRGAEKRRSRRGQRSPTLGPNVSGAISGVGCRAWPKTRCRMTGCVSWVRRRTPRTATAYSRCEVAEERSQKRVVRSSADDSD